MNRLRPLILWSLAALPGLLGAESPSIVFILADDLGYGDIACYGAPDVATPRIDRLAREGVKFTQFYANGTECSPTRTSIFTGRYPQRVGGLDCAIGTGNVGRYDDAIRLASRSELGLPPEDAVLPQPLKDRGYRTAVFGKWHLGYEPRFLPSRFGFDQFFGFLGGNVDYFTHRELSDLEVLYRDEKPVQRDGYMNHLIRDEALRFLREDRQKPFFLYLPFGAPHFPFQAPGDAGKVFTKENWTQGSRETYVAMIQDLDAQVGAVLDELDRSGRTRNTIVVFASDHGAMGPGRNLPFRGQKGGLFEGGIRAPLIVRWPGEIPPGTVCHQVTLSMDLTRSFLRVADARPSKTQTKFRWDGIDILEHVQKGAADFPRTVFWRARRGDRTWWAVRDGKLKYVARRQGKEVVRWLFDLAADAAEIHDLSGSRGEDMERLSGLLRRWEKEVEPQR